MNNKNKKIDPASINGWGIDYDDKNEPTYPIKNYTGDDHKRREWERPELQTKTVEILKSTERPMLSAVFGTTYPPKGLSGAIRRLAFRFSENMYRHWLPLILADRVDAFEGLISDVGMGHIPSIYKEMGWNVIARHNKKLFARKVATHLAFAGLIIFILTRKNGVNKNSMSEQVN